MSSVAGRRITLRALGVAAVVVSVGLPAAGAAAAAEPVIPAGASVSGVPVGGLPLSAAADRLEQSLAPVLRAPVEVRVAGHRHRLTPRRVKLEFDPLRSARRANIAARAAIRAGEPPRDVKPWVRYSADRLNAFTRKVQRSIRRRPRNARLRFTVTTLKRVRSRVGYRIDRAKLRDRLRRTLEDPSARRTLRVARKTVRPRVRTRDLADRYRTVVTVHRRGFRLRLFKRLEQVAGYRVAVGMPGYRTPRGRFRISNKARNPAWYAPDRPWAGAYRNEVVAGGSDANPLKARWLGVVGGVGIHGTQARSSLGTAASHGCIRMSVPAVKRLYRRVPVGTLVMIK